MSSERLLKYFDQIAEAPDAVPRLRRFILDLAVRGKLVEQDPADEPASELLERIQAEKARLVKEGIIRMPSPVAPLDQTECLFDLPGSWQWIRLAEAGSIIGGGTPPSKDSECFTERGKGVAWLTPADLGKHKSLLISHGERDLTEKGLASSSAQLMPAGSVLFTSRAPIGYTAIAENEISTNQGFKSIVPFIMDFNRYIAVYFKAFASWIDGKASGTTFKEVSGKIVANLPFPLPPLPEQHRIVGKVDELMVLCNELEAGQAKREGRRDRLVAGALHGLNNTDADPETGPRSTFEESARFYFIHLPRLTTRSEHIQKLRQTVLNLAVRGKLVPQDPKDEPVNSLIAQIETKRKQRASEGEPISYQISADVSDIRFPVPQSWKWVRLGVVTNVLMGQSPPGETYNTHREGIPLINGPVEFSEGPFGITVLNQYTTAPTRLCKKGDLLLCVRGSTTGRTNVAGFDACIGRGVAALQPLYADQFVRLFIWSWRDQIIEMGRGIAFPSISRRQIEDLATPFPPLAEQHRIVAKVDELMVLCDELETQLTEATNTRRQLLEATLCEAIAS